MARRKKSWGPSNPLWRYLHKRGATSSRTTRRHTMARRRYGRRRGRGGGSKLFGLSTKGVFGSFGLLGVAAAALFADDIAAMVPVNVPYKNYLAAGAVGGVAGVAAKGLKDMLLGSGGVSGGGQAAF